MSEIWKQYRNTSYQVSNAGRVRNNKSNGVIIYLKPQVTHKGYHSVGISKHGKKFIHRLVGECFLPMDENKPFINHKNFIKTDNRVENLEWCSVHENNHHAIINGKMLQPNEYVVFDYDGNVVCRILSLKKLLEFKKFKKVLYLKSDEYSAEAANKLIQKKLETIKIRATYKPNTSARLLTDEQVRAIRTLLNTPFYNHNRVAQLFNVEAGTIESIIKNKTYRDVLQY